MFTWVLFGIFFYLSLAHVHSVIPGLAHFSSKPEDYVVPRNVTPICLSDTKHWLSELRRGVPWALKMLDAAAKLTSGVMLGSHNNFGNFVQCIAVSVDDGIAKFRGHFCRPGMDLETPGQVLPTPGMVYGFCVPSSCIPEEIPELLQNHIAPALGIVLTVYSLNPMECTIKVCLLNFTLNILLIIIKYPCFLTAEAAHI